MSPRSNLNDCESAELTCAYAAQALASSEVAAAEAQELHLLDGFPISYKSKVSPYLLGY